MDRKRDRSDSSERYQRKKDRKRHHSSDSDDHLTTRRPHENGEGRGESRGLKHRDGFKSKEDRYKEKIELRRAQKEAEYQAKRAKWEAERPRKPVELAIPAPKSSENPMMEVICNDRLGGKVRIKCYPTDTIKNLKLLISAHTGTRPEKIRL